MVGIHGPVRIAHHVFKHRHHRHLLAIRILRMQFFDLDFLAGISLCRNVIVFNKESRNGNRFAFGFFVFQRQVHQPYPLAFIRQHIVHAVDRILFIHELHEFIP